MQRLAPDGDPLFRHQDEGPDDMPAHVRSVITQSALSLPVAQGRCHLGTWQGVYLWEHRTAAHRRRDGRSSTPRNGDRHGGGALNPNGLGWRHSSQAGCSGI
jgi:hypothetical protein